MDREDDFISEKYDLTSDTGNDTVDVDRNSAASSPDFVPAVQGDKQTILAGMFRDWYLEYASYVILERAVPHIEDGLKPVQRRILHSMQTIDDGRFNKVANIVGNTMQYHPHGDASIGGALVQLGQKDLLVDTQGNWGNILTGDDAAAPRYIEARLSEFALETVFNPKITEWTLSYDGRKREPVTLPVKFPLLLAQGVEGIAVGLSSKILPHNFNEILDAAVAYLKDEPFQLIPDFQTGGLMDVSRYNDGARGGVVKVRAKIEKVDNKTLAITEIPFGKNTDTIIKSILAAMDKGKIKIRHVDNNTSATAEILVHLAPGTSSDKAIDALYAFTDCEVSISPNCCVIWDKKPRFLTVSDLLRFSVDHTQEMHRQELEIRLGEAQEARMLASLEKIFIQERMYKDKIVEKATDMDAAILRVDQLMQPFKASFFREVVRDDLLKLWEIKMARILAFNVAKAEEKIAALENEIDRIRYNLSHIVEYTIGWYEHLKEKYGEKYPRKTVVRGFDSIEAAKVAEANKRFFFDKEGGFIGTGLKDNKFLFTCSDLDDVIIIYRDGKYKIVKVQDKFYVGKKILHIGLFKKGDERTIYNVIYRNGKDGFYYKKRFFITGLTRDKEYDITKGLPGSKIEWFTANANGEAEIVRVTLKNEAMPGGRRPRNSEVIVDFSDLAIKGKEALGNLVTKHPVASVTMIEKGASTLGGREVWFDRDVLRLNYDGRGDSLGVFQGDDKILVLTNAGEFYTTGYSDEIHFDDNIARIEKFDAGKIWTLVLFDASQGFPYIKRFKFELSAKPQRFVGTEPESREILLTDTCYPRIRVDFAGADASRLPLVMDAEEFIGVKSFKAKGKRLTSFELGAVTELEPVRFPDKDVQTVAIQEEITETPEETDKPKIIQGDLFGEE